MNLAGLIVALGNPGKQYEQTRHNLGWLVLDEFINEIVARGIQVNAVKGPRVPMRLWRAKINGGDWFLCKPETFMNLSGEAVGALARFYHIEAGNLLVLHDEADLPLGRMKLKKGGGTAGHNGLKSVIQHLGSQDFSRLRLGVGKPKREESPGQREMADYVLASFRPEEAGTLVRVIKFAAEQLYEYTREDFNKVVGEVNSFDLVKG